MSKRRAYPQQAFDSMNQAQPAYQPAYGQAQPASPYGQPQGYGAPQGTPVAGYTPGTAPPAQGQQYPSQGQQYPSQGQQYPSQGQQYPSQGQQYPPQPQAQQYPAQPQYPGQAYPAPTAGYPSAGAPPPVQATAPAAPAPAAAPIPVNPLADAPFRPNEHVSSGKGQSSVPSAGYPAYGQAPVAATVPPPAAPVASSTPPAADAAASAGAAAPAAAPVGTTSAPVGKPGRRVYAEMEGGGAAAAPPMHQQVPLVASPSGAYPGVGQFQGQSQVYNSPDASQGYSAGGYGSPQQQATTYGSPADNWTPPASAQCPDRFLRTTMGVFPQSDKLLLQTGLPLGCVIQAMAEPEEKIPTVSFPPSGISRCRKCRAYINPFVQFVDSGRRWRCNLCSYLNDVPNDYYCMVGPDGLRYDVAERKELSSGCVEIIAPAEYMVRPPQPSVYFFVIDVTYAAVTSGMLHSVVSAIKRTLDRLAEDERTRVGFIAFDEHVHFFNLRSSLSKPQMLVVPDISVYTSAPFVPLKEDLLVNFQESRAVVEALLDSLPLMYQNSKMVESALGPAMSAATAVVKPVGGKIILATATLPTVGVGKLRNRQSGLTTDKEVECLRLADEFYKTLALDQSRVQVSTDVFLFAPRYLDAASLGVMPRITGGQLYFYNLAGKDHFQGGRRLEEDLRQCITRETGFEAVMRVRCTKGLKVREHFGNFFVRTNDLLALPNIDRDKSVAVHFEISNAAELLQLKQRGTNHVSIQAALLYTTSYGQRRIRSMTKCIPLSGSLADVYASLDLDACMNLFARIALEKALSGTLGDARQAIMNKCVDILAKYQVSFSQNSAQQIACPPSLNAFPMLTLALIKSGAFRQGADISLDERTSIMHTIRSGPMAESRRLVYPDMYALGALPPAAGLPDEQGKVMMPPTVELGSDKIDRRGVFLIDNGIELLMWVGKSAHPDLLRALFNIQSLEEVDANNSQLYLVPYENDYSKRVNAVVEEIRRRYPSYRQLYVFKEGDRGEQYFFSFFVHDRMRGNYSYPEFLRELQRTVMAKAWKR